MVGTLADSAGSTLRARTDSLECTTFIDHDSLDDDVTVVQFFSFVLVLASQLAIALRRRVSRTFEGAFLENLSRSRAWLTSTPLTVSATRRILRGDDGTSFAFAIAVWRLISFSLSAISLLRFPIISDQLSDFTYCYLNGL